MPYVLQARSGPGNLWVMRDHPGQPEYGDEVLEAVDATGYRAFPVEVRGKRGETIGDYVGFAVLDADPAKDLRFELGYQGWSFVASDRVVDALKAAEVTELSVKRVTS
ncbi:hypothetical protein [Kribbella sp. DT2]|uniref:hypothetical protein n=1 Tax=Kribbella sp. DT2 TaxID=3393427 RepID=UPI003CEEE0B9